jgi:hypothetical protein
VLALPLGCGSSPNMQYVPIGSRCGSDGDCGTSPYSCDLALPSGYCTRTCLSDADCPTDSACVALSAGVSRCRRKCIDPLGCRVSDGYTCKNESATSLVCDKP